MRNLVLVFVLLLMSTAVYAGGNERVRTKLVIVDATDGSALIGATVRVEGYPEAFYTDPEGVVELNYFAGDHINVSVSYISFQELTLALSELPEDGLIKLGSR